MWTSAAHGFAAHGVNDDCDGWTHPEGWGALAQTKVSAEVGGCGLGDDCGLWDHVSRGVGDTGNGDGNGEQVMAKRTMQAKMLMKRREAIIREIKQTKTDIESWNDNYRKPGEERIDSSWCDQLLQEVVECIPITVKRVRGNGA